MDANQKNVGDNYEGLPESFVIFITERDVLVPRCIMWVSCG